MVEQLPLFWDEDIDQPPETPESSEPALTRLTRASSLREALDEFDTAMLVKGFSQNTIKAFQADLRILAGYVTPAQRIGQISTHDLNGFLAYLLRDRGRPCNLKSFARRITTLKVFFGWLHDVGVLSVDPSTPLVHGSVHTPLPRVLNEEQVERLRSAGQALSAGEKGDPRPLLLVELLLNTGMKKSECMGIHLSHIDLSHVQEPTVQVRYREARQKHKDRNLWLGAGVVPILRAYREKYQPAEYLFECTARNLEYVLRDVAQAAGIEGGVSFESLRWTAALRDYQGGMDADALRQKLGLSKLRWREALEKLEQLAQPPA